MKKNCDILIIGAGPAGVIAAAWAHKLGYSVIVADKGQFPRDKICGDLMPPMCMQLINELDKSFSAQQFDSISVQQLFFRNETDNYEVLLPPSVQCISSPRKTFDNALLSLLAPGITFLQQANLQAINCDLNHTVAHLQTADGPVEISCNYLLGADGSNSKVKRLIFPSLNEHIEFAIAVRSYCEQKQEISSADSFFTESALPGYYWLFPSTNNTSNTGILLPPNHSNTSLRNNLLREFIKSKNQLGAELSMSSWTVPTLIQQSDVAARGCFLIGDAAGLCEPIFAHGIDIAMLSAKNCIQAIYNTRLLNNATTAAGKVYSNFISSYMVPKFQQANHVKNSAMKTKFDLTLLYDTYVNTMILNTDL